MRIQELVLQHFGKFTDKTIRLEEGINILYGENGSGKTTVHTFLNGMLFGLERGRGKAAANDTFSRYEPWENPNYYAGMLRFTCGGRHFCLRRNFDRASKRVSLICEDDGEELSPDDGDLTALLDGLEKGTFEETIGIAQRKPEAGETLASQLQNYATNYYAAGDQALQPSLCLQYLKEEQKALERQERQEEQKRQEKREGIEQNMSYVWRDIHKFREELEEVQGEIQKKSEEEAVKKQKYEEFYQQKLQEEKLRESKWRVHPIEYLGMLLAVIFSFLFLSKPWSYLWAIVLALVFGIYIWNRMKDGKKKPEEEDPGPDLEPEQASLEKLSWEEERIQVELKEKETIYGNLQEQLEEIETGSSPECCSRREALKLAEERIAALADEMRQEIGTRFNNRISEILSDITGGTYTRIWVSDQLEISLLKDGKKLTASQVSRGTLEQIYFAIRMAAQEILYEEELPVILDDAFVYYDDERLRNTLRWLSENRNQVLLFTCQTRERRLLEQAGLRATIVEW